MSNEDIKLKKLTSWANDFPSVRQNLPVLLKMRTGPLKDFVDKHLVPFVKSDDWIKTMEEHFRLEELRRKLHLEKESLDEEKQKLEVLRHSLFQLKRKEEELEIKSSEQLCNLMSKNEKSSWSNIQDKLLLTLQEKNVQAIHLLYARSRSLRSKIESLVRPSRERTVANVPNSNFLRNVIDAERLNADLDETKKLLRKSFLLIGRLALRKEATHLATRADESLSNVAPVDSDVFGVWCSNDLEVDRHAFLSDVNEMKTIERVPLIQKLAEEWTEHHVRLFFKNQELQANLTQAKGDANQKRLAVHKCLQPVMEILEAEKKREAVSRHFYNINIKNQSCDVEEKIDRNGTKNCFSTNSSCTENTGDEFNFDLLCSLLKTWSNAKSFHRRGVVTGNSTNLKWVELSEKVNSEMKIAMEQIQQNHKNEIQKEKYVHIASHSMD